MKELYSSGSEEETTVFDGMGFNPLVIRSEQKPEAQKLTVREHTPPLVIRSEQKPEAQKQTVRERTPSPELSPDERIEKYYQNLEARRVAASQRQEQTIISSELKSFAKEIQQNQFAAERRATLDEKTLKPSAENTCPPQNTKIIFPKPRLPEPPENPEAERIRQPLPVVGLYEPEERFKNASITDLLDYAKKMEGVLEPETPPAKAPKPVRIEAQNMPTKTNHIQRLKLRREGREKSHCIIL